MWHRLAVGSTTSPAAASRSFPTTLVARRSIPPTPGNSSTNAARLRFGGGKAIARNEQRAIEADRLHRSQIWQGLPADSLPVGVAPAAAMLQAARDDQPKRQSPMEEAFSGKSMTYHAWPSEDES